MDKENTEDPTSAHHERQAYDIRLLKSAHPDLRLLKAAHKPSVQGHKAWNSTYLLLDFLQDQQLPKGPRVLEVGCGWGLLSIFCARCVQTLDAREIDWSTQEPTVVWSGASPQIRGRLLLIDRTPAKSLLNRSPA